MAVGLTGQSKHIPILDGIRAYAVLMVCVLHFFTLDETGLLEANRYLGIFLFKISEIGEKGVELFFILSGFLITGILIDSKTSPNYFRTFYARRFLRIFPLYYFVLFVSFAILPQFISVDAPGLEVIHNQIWIWTYTSNLSFFFWPGTTNGWWDAGTTFPWFGHFWSLCVEEHFYILWPLLVYIAPTKYLSKVMWAIVAFSAGAEAWTYMSDAVPILKWSTLRCAGILSLGGLIAWYRRDALVFPALCRFAKVSTIPLGVLFIACVFTPRAWGIHGLLVRFASVLFWTSVIVVALSGGGAANALFNHRFLFFIGKISYGIYIYHGMLRPYFKEYIYLPLASFCPNGIVASCIYTLVCTALSILLASVSWYLIESPILSFKSRFRY